MKPWQGLEKVDLVQFLRLWFGSWRDWERWVKQSSSFGSDLDDGRLAQVSVQRSSMVQTPI